MANILKKRPSLKRVGALVLALLVILTTLPTNSMLTVFAAAKKPVIAKTSTVALNGTKALKITKNGYTITSVKVKSNKSAVAQATATNSKVKVFGIKAGQAKITATIEAKKGNSSKTFKLTSTVKVKNPSAKLSTSNLKVGETASVKVSNAANGAKITYTSSDNSVATVNANGIVTAVGKGTSSIKAKIVLKKTKYAKKVTKTVTAGDVTVTEEPQNGQTGNDTPAGTTTGDGTTPTNTNTGTTNTSTGTSGGGASSGGSSSGGSSSGSSSSSASRRSSSGTSKVTKTVSTQAELESALKNTGLTKLTIQTDDKVDFTIPEGTYSSTDLIVNAPKADITNNGTFKSIEIQAIAKNTWKEQGNGNRITVTSSNPVRIVVNTLKALAALIFDGTSSDSNEVDVQKGELTTLDVKNTAPVNVKVEGDQTTKVGTMKVSSAAKTSLTVSGSAAVSKLEVSGSGADVSVKAGGSSEIGTVEVSASASGTAENQTKIDITAEGGAEITNVTTAASNSSTNIVSNGNSKVSTVKVEGTASVSVSGSSTETTTIDIKNATGENQVTVKTTAVVIVAEEGTDVSKIIDNETGAPLEIKRTDDDGNVIESEKLKAAIAGLTITGGENVYTASATTPGTVSYKFYYGESANIKEFNDKELKVLTGAGITINGGVVTLGKAFKLENNYLYVVATADGYEDGFAVYKDAVMEAKAVITLDSIKITDKDEVHIEGKYTSYDGTDNGKFYLSSGSAISFDIALDDFKPDSEGKINGTSKAVGVESGGAYSLIYSVDKKVEKAWSKDAKTAEANEFAALKLNLAKASSDNNKVVIMTAPVEIPEKKTLEIPDHVTLTINNGVTLTNKGTITNNGELDIKGKLDYTNGTINGTNGIKQYAVLAPLVDKSTESIIAQETLEEGYSYKQNSIEVKDNVTYIDVTVADKKALAHKNGSDMKGYWFGLGFDTVDISTAQSTAYQGFTSPTNESTYNTVSNARTSSMTKNDVAYDTYYFGMTKDSSGNWTNTSGTYSRTGYVAFKASESLKYVFTINFEITPNDTFLSQQ